MNFIEGLAVLALLTLALRGAASFATDQEWPSFTGHRWKILLWSAVALYGMHVLQQMAPIL